MNALAMRNFGFGDQLVRVIDREDSVWFVANDVCGALELSNPRDAVGRLEDDERDDVGITDAIGRNQKTTIVSESGVYALIFTSRKPIAKEFRKWVTGQVLPSIRRTGKYEVELTNQVPAPSDALDFVEKVRAGLQMVREARIVFGIAAARRAWVLAGLPDVSDDPTVHAHQLLDARAQSVAKWFADRMEMTDSGRESAMRLYMDYTKWCDEGGEDPTTLTMWGRAMHDMGMEKMPNRRGSIEYLGVRLKP